MERVTKGVVITIRQEEKDVGGDRGSITRKHDKITGRTLNLLRNIGVAFACLKEEMMMKIVITMICPRLKYAVVIWSSNSNNN